MVWTETEFPYGRPFSDQRVCREHVDILARVRPELSEVLSRIRTDKGWRRGNQGRWNESTTKSSERDKKASDCARRASQER